MAAIIALALFLVGGFFTLTPQGHAFAQDILKFFTRAESEYPPGSKLGS